jgi:hypothetical protein
MGYSDYRKKTSGTVVDGKLEIVVKQPTPVHPVYDELSPSLRRKALVILKRRPADNYEIVVKQPTPVHTVNDELSPGCEHLLTEYSEEDYTCIRCGTWFSQEQAALYWGVDQSKTEQAVLNIHDKCHKISCCFCGKVTSSGDKDHHVDGSHIYSCSNCGSFQSMVDCPTGCVGWGPSGQAMVVTQPRRNRKPKAETLAETASRIFAEKTVETALAPYVGKPNNDENRKAVAQALIDATTRRPGQTLDIWLTPIDSPNLRDSIEYCNKLVQDIYNISACPEHLENREEKLTQELFMDAVWTDAHEKAETKPGDTCAPPPQKVVVVVRKMFERPEYAAVRKVAEEQAKRIVGRRL